MASRREREASLLYEVERPWPADAGGGRPGDGGAERLRQGLALSSCDVLLEEEGRLRPLRGPGLERDDQAVALWVLTHAARPASGAEAVFRAGELAVDLERRVVTRGDQELRLTPTGYELLKALITSPDKVLTHRMLLVQVWGGVEGRTPTTCTSTSASSAQDRARPRRPRHLLTEPGVGYRFRTA